LNLKIIQMWVDSHSFDLPCGIIQGRISVWMMPQGRSFIQIFFLETLYVFLASPMHNLYYATWYYHPNNLQWKPRQFIATGYRFKGKGILVWFPVWDRFSILPRVQHDPMAQPVSYSMSAAARAWRAAVIPSCAMSSWRMARLITYKNNLAFNNIQWILQIVKFVIQISKNDCCSCLQISSLAGVS
jgi:hypothetical protein